MATSENDLLVRAAIIDELSGGLATIQAQVDELTVSLEGLAVAGETAGGAAAGGATAAGLGATAAGATELRTIARSTHAQVLSLSRGLTSELVSATKTALLGVGALGVGLTVLGVKSAATFQSARLGIQTFVGDVTKGNALFESLKGMQGPFNITNLQEAGQALLVAGTGADHLVPRMKALTDIAATQADPGAALTSLADAVGRIQEMGTLDTRTLRPLLTAGVPVYEMLSKELGVPQEQLRKTLATGAPVDLPMRFFADLEAETGPLERFQGAVENQRKTLRGQFTLIKTDASTALADVFAPLGDSLARVTPMLRTNLVDLIRGVGPGLTSFLTGVTGIVTGLIPILQPITASLLGALGQVLAALVPGLAQLAPQMPELATALANLVIAFIPLIPPLTDLTVALVPVLVMGIDDLTTAVTKVVGWLTPLIEKVTHLLDHSAAARRVVEGLFGALMAYAALTKVVGWITGVVNAVKALRTAIAALRGVEAVSGVEGAVGAGVGEATAGLGLGAGAGAAAEGGSGALGFITAAGGTAAIGVVSMAALGTIIDQAEGRGTPLAPNRAVGKQMTSDAQAVADAYTKTGRVVPGAGYAPPPGPAKFKVDKTGGGLVGYDPAGVAQATADMAAQGWRQNPKTGALERIPAVVVNGPLVHAEHLSSTADVKQAAIDAYAGIQRQQRERG
jgi:tape measure domain-containing protein